MSNDEYDKCVAENSDDPLALFCLAMFREPVTAERLVKATEAISGDSTEAKIDRAFTAGVKTGKREGYMLALERMRDYTAHPDNTIADMLDEVSAAAPGEPTP